MTNDQFSALAELIRMRGSASQEAARLVLVEGLTPAEASRQAGTTPQATNSALSSCRKGLELAARAVGNSGDLKQPEPPAAPPAPQQPAPAPAHPAARKP